MKLKDVIDIDGKLYQIICVQDSGSFTAEPIGEVVGRGFTRPQNDKEMIKELNTFCGKHSGCRGCCFESRLDCVFEDYTNSQLVEVYRIMKENE